MTKTKWKPCDEHEYLVILERYDGCFYCCNKCGLGIYVRNGEGKKIHKL